MAVTAALIRRRMNGAVSRQLKKPKRPLAPHAPTRVEMRFVSAYEAQRKTKTGPLNKDRDQSWKQGPKMANARSWNPGLQVRAGNRDHFLYLGWGAGLGLMGLLHLCTMNPKSHWTFPVTCV